MGEGERRVLGLVALWGIVMGGLGSASCYGRNCDGDTVVYGRVPGEGQLTDPDTWQSTPIDGDWVPFTKQRIVFFEMRDLGDRLPETVTPTISAERNPNRDGNWTIGAGNLAEQSGAGPGRIAIKNNTCADYYIRLVVTASPRPPATAPADAAAPTNDASTSDADAGD